jgi:hypothetical protein
LAGLYPAAEAFQNAHQDAALLGVRAMAGRVVQTQAAPDGLARDAPEIWMAGRQALQWP